MSKSYRKPYGTWVKARISEHDLKTLSSRIHRRAQEQAVREAFRNEDWDSITLPIREECKLGSSYDLRRDGTKRPICRGRQYNNQFAYNSYGYSRTIEEWRDGQRREDEYLAWASRK
jgi:hypothetical protein